MHMTADTQFMVELHSKCHFVSIIMPLGSN
jgi:hypothetical protein